MRLVLNAKGKNNLQKGVILRIYYIEGVSGALTHEGLFATVLGIGFADYWFGHHQLTAFLSWAVLATIPWLVGRASLFVLARR